MSGLTSPGRERIASSLKEQKMEEKVRLESLAKLFKEEVAALSLREMPTFVVNGPCKLTVKDGGEYFTAPFIGEEELVVLDIYAGKKELIFIFIDPGTAPVSLLMVRPEHQRIEIPYNKALVELDGFKQWSDQVLENFNQETIAETKQEVAAMEEAAHEEAKRDPFKENPLYGSW